MRKEYKEIIMGILLMLGIFSIIFLIVDLFDDGIFFIIMPIFFLVYMLMMIITLIMKAFQLNYKIIKRKND